MDNPSYICAADGERLAVYRWEPPGDAKAVLALIHGLGEHGGRYEHLARFLNDQGFLVLALDLRGHGRSPGARGNIPGYDVILTDIGLFVSDTARLNQNLPIFLYGHSMGGGMVLNYCLKTQPQLAGIIVTGPLLRTAFDPPAWKILLAKFMYRLWPALTLPNELDVTAISRDSQVVDAYINDPLVHNRLSVRLGVEMLARGEWALAHAHEFRLPLLVMHGDADRLTSWQAASEFAGKAGSQCTLKIWPGLYHEIHNEPEQSEVFAFLHDWLTVVLEKTKDRSPLQSGDVL